jgi:hypothetical protein
LSFAKSQLSLPESRFVFARNELGFAESQLGFDEFELVFGGSEGQFLGFLLGKWPEIEVWALSMAGNGPGRVVGDGRLQTDLKNSLVSGREWRITGRKG